MLCLVTVQPASQAPLPAGLHWRGSSSCGALLVLVSRRAPAVHQGATKAHQARVGCTKLIGGHKNRGSVSSCQQKPSPAELS